MQLWRQVIEQKRQGIVYRPGINSVVVVEDEDEIVRNGGDFVEQGRQDRLGRRWLGRPEHPQNPFTNLRHDRPQRGDEVSQKASEVVIPLLKRKPGGLPLVPADPFAYERGFTEACWGADEGQSAVQTLVKTPDQALAKDDSRLRWGNVEFSS